jgi:hypothetical protein
VTAPRIVAKAGAAERYCVMYEMLRYTRVRRGRPPQAALAATGRNLHTTHGTVAEMPAGEGEGVEIIFFKPSLEVYRDGWISDAALEREYKKRGLEPDPIALAAVNEANPAFADDHPNGAHWKGKDGAWCYIAFYRANGERYVYVHPSNFSWDIRWYFAGRRKVPSLAFTRDAPSIVAHQSTLPSLGINS